MFVFVPEIHFELDAGSVVIVGSGQDSQFGLGVSNKIQVM